MELRLSAVTVQLHNSLSYPWYTGDGCCVRGYAFVEDTLLQGDRFLSYMCDCTTLQELEKKLRNLNGFYNVILQIEDSVVACVDPVSSMPLFYTDALQPTICDGIRSSLLENSQPDQDLLDIFRHSLYVPGNRTLLKNVYQIRAGSYAVLENGHFRQNAYFRMNYASERISKLPEAIALLDQAFLATFRRTVEALNGRTAVLPLSGGHDSRLIAAYLKRLGYEKIIAYTYGTTGNSESSTSQKVADALQIPLHFVEYDPAGMRKLLKQHFHEFAHLAGNATAVPCLQEWYAVYRLKEQGVLDENCVIIPGYTGDFLAGAHLIPNISKMHPITPDTLKTVIRTRHFRERPFCKLTAQSALDALLEVELPELAQKDKVFKEDEANLIHEQFDWQNRQGIFIENALRVYDFFNIPWMTPLFERSQFDVWCRIHNSLRYGRRAFFALEEAVYPDALKNIGYADSNIVPRSRFGLLRKLALLWKGPSTLHPLYGYFRLGPGYLLDLLRHRFRGVNMYIQDRYLDILNTYWTKKKG